MRGTAWAAHWRRLRSAIDTQWRELGGLGRLALAGVVASLVAAVVLGFSIQRAAERHLLDARIQVLSGVTESFARQGLVPLPPADPGASAALHEAVQARLLGGETVRVKVWSPDGTVVYSDDEALIGRTATFGPVARAALGGDPGVKLTVPSESLHAEHLQAEHRQVFEFYLPITGPDGGVVGLFEVYERTESLHTALARIRRNVWLSIGSGLGILGLFMGTLTAANAGALNRRRRQSERLLKELLQAQDEERRRIVGALHDDVGQPVYRLLYGLQGSRARLEPSHPVADELARLEDLVREVDTTLRGELRLLHGGVPDGVDLTTALDEMVEATRRETDLDIGFQADLGSEHDPLVRAALYRAAQEAVTNIRKHAHARQVRINVSERHDRVLLTVDDDGDGRHDAEGLGLATTRERLAAVGGGLRVEAKPGRGTRVAAWVPMPDGETR
jgi:two-component system, NarL family, sensor kinase